MGEPLPRLRLADLEPLQETGGNSSYEKPVARLRQGWESMPAILPRPHLQKMDVKASQGWLGAAGSIWKRPQPPAAAMRE